ncbi:LLM class F420-dependent oxidoreductase [Streptomyces montanisoli]|uniref:LLM class F420-dependent oxidoreductase n=1 Tax=Streptomyces montanisoli TaxID=2798581 RepID=A0A940MHT6_9ACTN|nr:LLM class F420-dependent oxidoreductase [Streptomyces montanisoli]MBP0459481.1 LLM class F420-dependent oxidoreductase [Streptomyces montanisoli]
MKYGISTFITDQGIGPVALGRALEERGFGMLLVAEHSHIPVERRSPWPGGGELPGKYYRTLDPFVALTAAAVATEHLLVGTGVALVGQRDPIHTAKEVASLDLVSCGRAVFGVGVGWNREEMEDHGTDPATRGRLVNERLALIRSLWTEETTEFHGEFIDLDPVYSWPKPVHRPHPPIFVGGGERAFPRVARYGDAWLANGVPPEELGPQIDRLREAAGRDVPVTVFDASHDEADVAAYAELGVERLLFALETQPEAETLRALDAMTSVVPAEH